MVRSEVSQVSNSADLNTGVEECALRVFRTTRGIEAHHDAARASDSRVARSRLLCRIDREDIDVHARRLGDHMHLLAPSGGIYRRLFERQVLALLTQAENA
jgi:hypothetical protein